MQHHLQFRHHWNQQQSFWCLPAANRSDLLMSYMNTYSRLMPEALRVTKECGYKGLRWSEQHDFAGRHMGLNAFSFRSNHTSASQIALFYWWHLRHRLHSVAMVLITMVMA